MTASTITSLPLTTPTRTVSTVAGTVASTTVSTVTSTHAGHPITELATTSSAVPAVSIIAGLALVPMVVGQVSGAGVVDPVVDPISYYAFVPWGYEVVAAGAVMLGLCGVVLAHRLARLLAPQARLGAVMTVSFTVAMLLVKIFPTDPPGLAPLVRCRHCCTGSELRGRSPCCRCSG